MPEDSSELSPYAGRSRLSWALRRFWRARIRPLWREARAPIVITVGLAVVVFGTIGYGKEGDAWWEALFKSFQLYGFAGGPIDSSSPLILNIARVLGPLLVGIAAIRGLLVLSREQLRLIGFRLFRRNHIVIAGLGDVGFRLAASLNEEGARVIAIDRDATQPSIAGCKERGISALIGDATDPDLLRAACVHRARHLIVAPGLDSVTIDIVAAATAITEHRDGNPLRALAQIEDRRLWQAMEARALTQGHDPDVTLELFNLYESAGRLVLEQHPPFSETAAGERRGPAMLVLADQAIAEVLVVNAARLWRNARANRRSRLEITLAGPGAEAECARIRERYPALDAIAHLDPWEIDLGAPALYESERSREASAVYVALGDEAEGVATALVVAATNRAAEAIVLLINDERLGAAAIASGDARTGRIEIFGILNRALEPNFLLNGLNETMAREMHASYLRDQHAKQAPELPNLKPWDQLSEQAKTANRDYAASIPEKLAAVGCVVVPTALVDLDHATNVFEAEVERLAEAEHDRWLRDKLRDGWAYGRERDDAARIHPSLRPYAELDEQEKDKDRVAVRDLPEMLAKAGFAIRMVGESSS